jgi:hypothetical protein
MNLPEKKESSDQNINSIKKTVRVLVSKYFSKQYFPIVTTKLCRFKGRSQYYKKRLLASSCLSARPHETTLRPLEGFSLNLVFEYFFEICLENSSWIKIRKE